MMSCGSHPETKHTTTFEFDPHSPMDTINLRIDGKKQGKWLVKKAGKTDTLFYRNDTLITN
ncbi:MAG: hypothetical protein ACXVPQ_04545 [Bacteroidia bacterium]